MGRLAATPVLIFALISLSTKGQDTLPRFTAIAKANNRNLISWTNAFPYVSQIGIQRSPDSTRNFKTILTVPDPSVQQNGFVDAKAPAGSVFYRLFIVLDSGKYQFSRSKRPIPDTAKQSMPETNGIAAPLPSPNNRKLPEAKDKSVVSPQTRAMPVERFIAVKRRDSLIAMVSENNLRRFRDSMAYQTKDTLSFASPDTIVIMPFVPKEIYRASKYVYTEKFGNVRIDLPDAGRKKYSISFFDENKLPLFEISEVKSPLVTVDKANFIRSGWFHFELYEDGKLKEKHRIYIPRDF